MSIAIRATIHVSHQGGAGIDTCNYNGDEVDADMWYYDYENTGEIDGFIQNPIFSCENL